MSKKRKKKNKNKLSIKISKEEKQEFANMIRLTLEHNVGCTTMPSIMMKRFRKRYKHMEIKDLEKKILQEVKPLWNVAKKEFGESNKIKKAVCLITQASVMGYYKDRLKKLGYKPKGYGSGRFTDSIEELSANVGCYASNFIRIKFFKESFIFEDHNEWIKNIKPVIDELLNDQENVEEKLTQLLEDPSIKVGRAYNDSDYEDLSIMVNEYDCFGELLDYVMKKAEPVFERIKCKFGNTSRVRSLFSDLMGMLCASSARLLIDILREQKKYEDDEYLHGEKKNSIAVHFGHYVGETFLREFFKK